MAGMDELCCDKIIDYLKAQTLLCPVCNVDFKKPAHLSRHVQECHEEARPYACKWPDCNKTFKRDTHLKRHMISHTHAKPFPCEKCFMVFGYKHHLTRHNRFVHLRELYRCDQCEFQSGKKNVFAKHIKTHLVQPKEQGPKEEQRNLLMKCTTEGCISAFKCKWDLRRHIFKVHKKAQNEDTLQEEPVV